MNKEIRLKIYEYLESRNLLTIASLSSYERALIKAGKLGDSTLTVNADGKPTPGIEIGVAVTKSMRLIVG